jgi:hypothetical protein
MYQEAHIFACTTWKNEDKRLGKMVLLEIAFGSDVCNMEIFS